MRRYTSTTNPKLKGTTMNENTTEVKDLVTLNEKNEAITTSLKVAAKFGKRHDDVLKAIRKLDCSEDFRLRNFAEATYSYTINRYGATAEAECYHMTRDGFTFLVMGFTGSTAAQFKEEYIAAFNKMEVAQRNRQPVEVPLVSLENIQKLHGALGFTLKELERKEAVITQLETKTQEMKPKAEFFDAVSNARGNMSLSKAAKMLGRGPRGMIQALTEKGILTRNPNMENIPLQRFINEGYFKVRTFVARSGIIHAQTLVTPKGLQYLHRKLVAEKGPVAAIV